SLPKMYLKLYEFDEKYLDQRRKLEALSLRSRMSSKLNPLEMYFLTYSKNSEDRFC
ncbi:hypothetical protein PanWU01x14_089260, partial [Parasponia andersonii]